jgi:UPF0755 protein
VSDGHERTAREREAARLERERRRAAAGLGPTPAWETEAERWSEPEPLPQQPAAGAPEPEAEIEPAASRPPRAAAPSRSAPRRSPPPAPARTPRPPRPAAGARGSSPRRPAGSSFTWTGRILSVVAIVVAAVVLWFAVELFQIFGTSPHGRVTVTIAAHAGSRQIGDQLARDGVIPSGFFFSLRATLAGDRGDLRPGRYHLQLGMSYGAVLAALTKLPPVARTSELTISEGRTRQYVGRLLHEQGIRGNYVAATRSSRLLDPHAYGAPRHVPSLEGFLFPDTFDLVDPIKVSALVADQLTDFKRRFATVDLRYARRHDLTPYDVLKIASLIEAEAASPSAGPLVSSVIYNRLRDGMMLQLDSTTRYATGNFTRPITISQLRSPSPFNTHTHFGLPPTPIDSPGLAAIQAAAHPARSDYLYFFSKPCSNQSAFATTYQQFLYLLARDRRTHCP